MRRPLLLSLLCAACLMAADPAVTGARKKIADKRYDEAIAELQKSKQTPDVKKALGDAYFAKGDSFMYNDALPPRTKYTEALHAYRETVKYDPENKKAQENVNTIESIYKSMGRPVPQ